MAHSAPVLNPSQFQDALNACYRTRYSMRNRALLYVQVATAFRACELRRVTIGQFVREDGQMNKAFKLPKQMTKGQKKDDTVYFTNQRAIEALQEYLAWYKADCEKRRQPFSRDLLLFPSERGGEYHKTAIVRLFKLIYRKAGLHDMRSHSLRRTKLTEIHKQTGSVKAVQVVGRHNDIRTSARYVEIDPLEILKLGMKSKY